MDTNRRYLHPLTSLWALWPWKAAVSAVLAALCELIGTDLRLALVVTILVVVDLLTGIVKARRNGHRITSLGMRQTIVKAIEYAVLLFSVNLFANGFEYMSWAIGLAYFWVAVTELVSIAENMYTEGGAASKVWERVYEAVVIRGPRPEERQDKN